MTVVLQPLNDRECIDEKVDYVIYSCHISTMNLEDFRTNYSLGKLAKGDLSASPFLQFEKWLKEMIATEMKDPTAMVLATAGEQSFPNQRYVLLKNFDERGFVFFTDTSSTKGQELADNPKVSLLFPWHTFERQIRIQGKVEELANDEVEAYFHSRPVGSQLAAYTSNQSKSVSSREELVNRFEANKASLGESVPLPERWGGYRVMAEAFEFWQGGEHRLHDRFVYSLKNKEWLIERLQP